MAYLHKLMKNKQDIKEQYYHYKDEHTNSSKIACILLNSDCKIFFYAKFYWYNKYKRYSIKQPATKLMILRLFIMVKQYYC